MCLRKNWRPPRLGSFQHSIHRRLAQACRIPFSFCCVFLSFHEVACVACYCFAPLTLATVLRFQVAYASRLRRQLSQLAWFFIRPTVNSLGMLCSLLPKAGWQCDFRLRPWMISRRLRRIADHSPSGVWQCK